MEWTLNVSHRSLDFDTDVSSKNNDFASRRLSAKEVLQMCSENGIALKRYSLAELSSNGTLFCERVSAKRMYWREAEVLLYIKRRLDQLK